jgi:hypothetical protein
LDRRQDWNWGLAQAIWDIKKPQEKRNVFSCGWVQEQEGSFLRTVVYNVRLQTLTFTDFSCKMVKKAMFCGFFGNLPIFERKFI